MARSLSTCLLLLLAVSIHAAGNTEIKTQAEEPVAKAKKQEDVPCEPGQRTFRYTGGVESFIAPKGCVVVMSLWGAGGSNSLRAKGGGGGGFVRGAVDGEGQLIYVMVGQGSPGDSENYNNTGPFFGGGGKIAQWCGASGGGGGRSQVSHGRNPDDVDQILIVAGGGGGAGSCPASSGGSGGCRDDKWEAHCNGRLCNAEYMVYGKGGYGGRPHNDFFKGHPGGDFGGGGGGGYYGGGAGEGMCDFGSGGGGGSSWISEEFVYAVQLDSAKDHLAGNSLAEYGLDVGQGGTRPLQKGGNGLVMVKWFPKDVPKNTDNKKKVVS